MAKKQYTWDPVTDSTLEETDGLGSVLASYTNEPSAYGPLVSQNRDGESHYFHFDALGSTRELTDEDENVTDALCYDAWGNVAAKTGATETSFRWGAVDGILSGAHRQCSVRHRSYDPLISLWTSTDPLFEYLQSANASYAYCYNQPTQLTDPSGEHPALWGGVNLSSLQFVANGATTPYYVSGSWLLALLSVQYLSDRIDGSYFKWARIMQKRHLPPKSRQTWLLTTKLSLVTIGPPDCISTILDRNREDVLNIVPDDLEGGSLVRTDESISAKFDCCLDITIGAKIGGVNQLGVILSPSENKPVTDPQRLSMLRNPREPFVIPFIYTYINPRECCNCFPWMNCCDPPTECLYLPWGTFCNEDYRTR